MAPFAAALRASTTLRKLKLTLLQLWSFTDDDGTVPGLSILSACAGHPSLRSLSLDHNDASTNQDAAGAALAALISADGSQLEVLSLECSRLGDAGVCALFTAIVARGGACRLQELSVIENGLSSTAAQATILPAVRPNNTSLALLCLVRPRTVRHKQYAHAYGGGPPGVQPTPEEEVERFLRDEAARLPAAPPE